jgi:hypothetical protein
MAETLKRIHSLHSSGNGAVFFLGTIDSGVFPTHLRGYDGHSKEVATIELKMEVKHREI